MLLVITVITPDDYQSMPTKLVVGTQDDKDKKIKIHNGFNGYRNN